MYKYIKNMLPTKFNQYFIDLTVLHNHNTRHKSKSNLFLPRVNNNSGKNMLHFKGVKTWGEVPSELKEYSFYAFKKNTKTT